MLGCGSLHTLCPVGGVIPWVHVRESAGVWAPAHTVPSGRVIPCVHERECWGVGPCTHCAQWEGLYHGCT